MTKTDLVAQVAQVAGITRAEAQRVVEAVFSVVRDALARGEKVTLTGFGTFEVRNYKARSGRNPQTGETIQVPAHRRATFRAGKSLKDAVR